MWQYQNRYIPGEALAQYLAGILQGGNLLSIKNLVSEARLCSFYGGSSLD